MIEKIVKGVLWVFGGFTALLIVLIAIPSEENATLPQASPASVASAAPVDREAAQQVSKLPVNEGFPRRTNPARIETFAIAPYTRSEFPTTYRKFGSAVAQINADRRRAAEIAATYQDCDTVQNAQVSTSSPKANRRYWVECANLTRFYLDQESLTKNEVVDLQTKRDWLYNGLRSW